MVYKFGPFLAQFCLYDVTRIIKFPNFGKWQKIKFFYLKLYTKFRTFYCCLVAIYSFEAALKNLGKWRQRGASVSHLPLNILHKINNFSFEL